MNEFGADLPRTFYGQWGQWTVTLQDPIDAVDEPPPPGWRRVSMPALDRVVIASCRVERQLVLKHFSLQSVSDLQPVRDGRYRVAGSGAYAVITDQEWVASFAEANHANTGLRPALIRRLLTEPAVQATLPRHLKAVYVDGPHPELEHGLEDASSQMLVRLYREFTQWGSTTAASDIADILNVPPTQIYNKLRAVRRLGYLPAPGMGGRGRDLLHGANDAGGSPKQPGPRPTEGTAEPRV